jgi:hypothetical protein
MSLSAEEKAMNQIGRQLAANTKADIKLNAEDGSLPFAYYEPKTEGKIFWMCNRDQEDRITSVFYFNNGEEHDMKPSYLETMKDAEFHRDELIKAGWLKMKSPKVTFSYAGDESGEDKPMNRKQRRYMQKQMKEAQKKNPFNEN